MEKYIVLLPPPCTNANLHMGHLAGVYIPADIYAKYLILNGHEAISIGGADQNNTYTYKKALKSKKTFEYTKHYYADIIYNSLVNAGINCSAYIETASQAHIDTVKEIIEILMINKYIEIKKINQYYCDICQEYVVDSFASGTCISCHAVSDAGICENCNTPIFNYKLKNVTHTQCSNPAVLKPTNLALLNIKKLKENLMEFVENSYWESRLKKKYLRYLNKNEEDFITISYGFDQGVKIENFLLDVKSVPIWFEALWTMLTGLKEHYKMSLKKIIEILRKQNFHIVPFMGQDTEYYYTIGLSSVLLAIGANKIPCRFSVQRFIKLNGKKFSSSRNHIIILDELKEKYSIDFIRYYSISILKPYSEDNNNFNLIKMNNYYIKYQAIIKKICNHVDLWREKKHKKSLSAEVKKIGKKYCIAMENLKFNQVVQEINNLLKFILININKQSLSLEIASLLCMLKPIMPIISDKLGIFFFSNEWLTASLNKILNKDIMLNFDNTQNHYNVSRQKQFIETLFKE